jgi:hypothetical protein
MYIRIDSFYYRDGNRIIVPFFLNIWGIELLTSIFLYTPLNIFFNFYDFIVFIFLRPFIFASSFKSTNINLLYLYIFYYNHFVD